MSISAIHRMLKRHDWRPVDRAQIVMPRGWEPGERFPNEEASAYEDPPEDNIGSEAASEGT